MVCHAIAVYVGEQLTCFPPYQFNEQVYIVFIVYMHIFFLFYFYYPYFILYILML